jgi:hypothetical protein
VESTVLLAVTTRRNLGPAPDEMIDLSVEHRALGQMMAMIASQVQIPSSPELRTTHLRIQQYRGHTHVSMRRQSEHGLLQRLCGDSALFGTMHGDGFHFQ